MRITYKSQKLDQQIGPPLSYIEAMANKLVAKEDEAKYFSIGAYVAAHDYSIAGISFGYNRLALFYDSSFAESYNIEPSDIGRIGIVNIKNFLDHDNFIGSKQEVNDEKSYPPLKIAARAFICLGKNAVSAFDDDISLFCEWCSNVQYKSVDLANIMHQEGFLPDISEPDKKLLNAYFNKDQDLLLPERERLAFACWQYFNQPAKFPFGKSFVHSSQSDEKTFKSCAQNSGSKILFCYSGSLLGKGSNDWYITEKGFCWPDLSKFVSFDDILMVQSDLFFLKLTTAQTEHRFPISFVDSKSIEDFVLSMVTGFPLPANSLSSCFSSKFKDAVKTLIGGLACSGCLLFFPPVAAIMLILTPFLALFALLSSDKNESYTPYRDPENAVFGLLNDFKAFIGNSNIPVRHALANELRETSTHYQSHTVDAVMLTSNSVIAEGKSSEGKLTLIGVLGKLFLTLGIFGAPYIFAWFTLRPGHSTRERVLAFLWMFIVILILMSSKN